MNRPLRPAPVSRLRLWFRALDTCEHPVQAVLGQALRREIIEQGAAQIFEFLSLTPATRAKRQMGGDNQ